MKTFKEIATITYCDNDYLISQLNGLLNMGDIEFWCFINHKKEDITLKDHTHLFIQPICKLETRDLQFKQDETKGTMPYQKSDFGNWVFYCSHNKVYLQSKKLDKKYHYTLDDFISSDKSAFIAMCETLEIDEYIGESDNIMQKIKKAVATKIPFSSLVYNGWIPINQIRNYQKAYDLIWNERERIEQWKNKTDVTEEYNDINFDDLLGGLSDDD